MPGFQLEQVDGGSPVDLPYGETVLGRGPFLGVNDKRVSRNHGILENQNSMLRLKPTHVNPCFIQTNIVAPPQPLEKDQWHCLKDGDIFSLMPGKYIYRVHIKENDQTLRNSQAFGEDVEVEKGLSGAAQLSKETLEASSCTHSNSRHTHAEEAGGSSYTLSSLNEPPSKSQQDESALPQRKRVLPVWMTTSVAASSSPKVAKGTPKKAKRVATPKRVTGPKQTRTATLLSEEDELENKTPRRKTKPLKSDSEDESMPPLDDATAPSGASSVPEGANGTEVMERNDEDRKGGGRRAQVRPGDQAQKSRTQTEDCSDSQVSQGLLQRSEITETENKTRSEVKKLRRTACPYGSSCYRKNPLHFHECSHPGDRDFEEQKADEEEEEDENDDLPECPYGTHCYRKNPLHKKEYKHTKSPPKNTADDDDDDENEDQYENSFINDESEVDEDSDYVPESDGSGKEDIKRLQKEAKSFLRRKK